MRQIPRESISVFLNRQTLERKLDLNKRGKQMKYPRAYYIGGFSVGTGVPRVKIIDCEVEQQTSLWTRAVYTCEVTSRNCYAYPKGERFKVTSDYLFDSISWANGPRVNAKGKAWLKAFDNLIYGELQDVNK